ncbi:MAG: hypothetical protein ACJ76I_08120 [Gaiellaceae bacterium]
MKRLLISLVAVAALAAPSAALAGGVVLKVQRASHLVAVAQAGKKVELVHTAAAARLHVGQRVALSARTLRNGTLAARAIRVVGRAHTVRFRGLLLAKSRTRLVVSAAGAVISLHRGGRTTASAGDSGPTPGATVDVTATVGHDHELDEAQVSTVSADAPGGAIEGKLTIGAGKVTVVAEHMALVLNVPARFDLSKFANGDEVLAKFTQGTDGTLTLTALSGDDNEQEADQNDDQGDDPGDDEG